MKEFIKNSKWFHRESKKYVGKPRETIFGHTDWTFKLKDKLYYPIAYIKFMWLCVFYRRMK